MSNFIEVEAAGTDVLACAAFVAERVGSSDGHAAAVSDIALRYAAKGEVDLAASLADTIQDPHARDQALAEIAGHCVEFNDDEYGLQLVEAIEDAGFQQQALSNLAIRQAGQNKIDEALQTASGLEYSSVVEAEISIRLERGGDEAAAREILDRIESETIRVQVLNEFARRKIEQGEPVNAILTEALTAADQIEFREEQIQSLNEIASLFLEAKLNDKAYEVLQKSEQLAPSLDERFRDQVLTQIALLYARGGNFERAEAVLKSIVDLQYTATAHAGIAHEHHASGNDEQAFDSLEESYAVLMSQPEREIRDSRARFNLLSVIAVRFAESGKFERALEIALNNQLEEASYAALSRIAAICAAHGKEDLARQAVNQIEDFASKQNALVGVSDVERRDDAEKSLQTLNEAYALGEEVGQLPMRSAALGEIAVRFAELGDQEKARRVLLENLQTVQTISDSAYQAIALANAAEIYEKLNFEIGSPEREILEMIIRRRA